MLRLTLQRLRKVPHPNSAARNVHSRKARERMALLKGQQQQQHEEEMLPMSSAPKLSLPVSKKGRQTIYSAKVGKDVADRAKSMSDAEWEAVPLADKHHFTKFIGKQLREHPTMVSEQQRRRYFETTMLDPRDLNPHQSVKDKYERIKMGLPVELTNPQRQLGVSQAMYESAEASMFDPENAHIIENAMTHFKQVFVDYVKKKRQGLSTEAERRLLSSLGEDLNYETQKHLAAMFKYADQKVLQMAKEERHAQLLHLQNIAEVIKEKRSKQLPSRAKRMRELMRNAYGLDANVAGAILKNLRAQENFLEMCEVMMRMSLGSGFHHTKRDESLDQYIQSLKNLYSADPQKFATVDFVQFLAAKDSVTPVDWAKRWYEDALMLPLRETEEFKALDRIRREEDARAKEAFEIAQFARSSGEVVVAGGSPSTATPEENAEESAKATRLQESTALVAQHAAEVASEKQHEVINLVDKMYLNPDDKRLASIHEKRLRYLVYLQLETQIQRAREHAKKFEGVELLPEAEECRELYRKILARKEEVMKLRLAATASTTSDSLPPAAAINVYEDEQLMEMFERLRAIVKSTIKQLNHANLADKKAMQLTRVLRALKGGQDDGSQYIPEAPSEEARRLSNERKAAAMNRIMSLVERDVREDVAWMENLEESERPPLLPIPEPMSYVSAQDVAAWSDVRSELSKNEGNPFAKAPKKGFQANLMGVTWKVPDKPLLFWGTGITALQKGLEHAAEDAERLRRGQELAPPYPCPENPWGWRLVRDILDE